MEDNKIEEKSQIESASLKGNEKRYAKNLSQLREMAGMNTDELASRVGVYTARVIQWENGETEPSDEEYEKIALILHVGKEDLQSKNMQLDGKKVYAKKSFMDKVNTTRSLLIGIVWLVATLLFCVLNYGYAISNSWLCFMYALPMSCLVSVIQLVIVNTKLCDPKIISYLSGFVWLLALSLFLTFLNNVSTMWIVFVAAVPLQAIIVSLIKLRNSK